MTADFTFVHAADLHLGAPFEGIDADDPRVAAALVESTGAALDRIVETCLTSGADFLVLSGDTTNDKDPSLRAQRRFQLAMERLDEAGVRVYLVRGNHDPAEGWSAKLPLPAGVHVFPHSETERVEHIRDGEVVCTLYGRSYAKAAERGNLARTFKSAPGDAYTIGVLHANVGADTGYLDYAPCTLGDLAQAGMDYWALGHIHKPETLSTSPLVVYPGSPQGLNPKEDGVHGCLVVRVSGGTARLETVPTASVRWDRREVDLTEAEDLEDVRHAIAEACEHARGDADGRDVVVRLALVGRTRARADLARAGVLADLLSDARLEQMSGEPWAWIDRLSDRSAAPLDLDALRGAEDFAGDVVRIAHRYLADAASGQALVDSASDGMRCAVGTEAQVVLDPVDVIERARAALLDLLVEEEER